MLISVILTALQHKFFVLQIALFILFLASLCLFHQVFIMTVTL